MTYRDNAYLKIQEMLKSQEVFSQKPNKYEKKII